MKYRFTVYTPCYNSEKFIHRVYESLRDQNFRDFEWYVINDASKDNTIDKLKEYKEIADFPMRILDLETNQNIYKNFNQAIKDANGEYFIAYGHDDRITKDALETFDQLLKKYNTPNIGSVYALAEDQNAKLVGKKYPKDEFISNYWVQFFDEENEAEKFQCWKTEYLKEFYPIPTDEKNKQTTSWLSGKFGAKYDSVFVNKILRTYYLNVSTQITANTKRDSDPIMVYNYYVSWVNEFQYHIKNRKRRLKGIGGCVSYGLLAGKSIGQILSDIHKYKNKLICLLMYPVALYYNKRTGN